MRKQFLLMLILCLASAMVWAERIDVATARKVAESVAQREGATGGLRSAGGLSLVYAAAPGQSGSALRSGTVDGAADYFVFNFPGEKGFAIVAGDDRVRPVLGYSDEGSFDPDNLPENLRGWLAYYQSQIDWANAKSIEATPDIAAEWSQLMSGTALRATEEPWVLPTANWSQSEPYNRQTPVIDGQHAVTGCVATAMGIIMKYYEYPTKAVNPPASNAYRINGAKTSSQITYGAYDWGNMLPTYGSVSYNDAQANAVATLLWHCGANVYMNYTSNESGANTPRVAKALSEVFGYSPSIRFLAKEAYRWEEWKAMLKAELDDECPVIYDGQSRFGGHAFICDGYNPEGLFHINWGWNGSSNGFYVLSLLDDDGDGYGYSEGQGMILNIRPEQSGERYYVRPYLTAASYSKNGLSASVSFDLRYYALENHGFYMELGVVDQNNHIIVTPSSPKIMDLEAYEGGWMDYRGISRSIDLSSDLADGQRITLLCSLDGTNWEVMRAWETVPTGIDNNGVINPSPDDPNDPEQSVNAGIYWNQFDESYMRVTGLDNSKNNSNNTKGISYWISNVKETSDVILRYKIMGYDQWKEKIAIYRGDHLSPLYQADQGTPVSINSEGIFDITVNKDNLANGLQYTVYMKVLSAQAGELTYDIQVIQDDIIGFEQKGNKMYFAQMEGSWDKTPIRGAVNQEIPFGVRFSDITNFLVGKDLALSITIGGATKEQVQLFDEAGQEIPLSIKYDNEKFVGADNLSVGSLIADKLYSFKLKSNTIFSANEGLSMGINATVDGKAVSSMSSARIIIDPADVKTYSVTLDPSSDLKLENAKNVIEEGKEYIGQLICEKEGYRIPLDITVTMGGTTLVAGTGYTYNSTNGWINIPAVTGNVVITASAEQIPPVIHTIFIEQLENLESDLTNGSISIVEGLGFTVKLTAKAGYLLPEKVEVKNGDTALKEGEDYTYTYVTDRKSGEIKINAVNSDLKIYAIGVPEAKTFTIKGELTNLTADKDIKNGVSVKENDPFEFTLTPAANYRRPDAITILNGETPLVAGADKDYTYDQSTGKVVIFKVTSDLIIKAAGIDASQIQVVFDLEGVVATPTSVGPFTINTKPQFEVAFTAAEGYAYDGTISVKMGDRELSTPADYEYVPENDLPFTLKTPLTATLTITAKGVKKQYAVDLTKLTNLTADPKVETATHGDPLSFKLVPAEGYDLPDNVTITMAGIDLTEGYTYNKADGTVTIDKVTGDVAVTAAGVLKTYAVTLNLTNLTSNFTAGKIGHGLVLEMQLSVVSDDSQLPKEITVKMNGQEFTDYKYENGWLYIGAGKITGPIEITAEAAKSYPVTDATENLTIGDLENVAEGETFTSKLVPAEGYHLPYAIRVIMGGRLLNAGEYAYDNVSGEIEIPNVSGPISIMAKGVEDGKFEVVLNLTNLTSAPGSFDPQAKDTKIELTLSPASGYELPGSILVAMDGTTLTAGTGYTYDRSTGKFTLEKITGTLVITVSGSRVPDPDPTPEPTPDPTPTPSPTTYTVTLPVVEGATITAAGSTSVNEGKSFSFTVTVKEGYKADNLVVKANGTTLTPDANGRYTIGNIRSNVVVTVTGIVKDGDPTANESIGSDELRVWNANGRLFIRTPKADTAYIVTFDGRLYKTLSLPAGEYAEPMPQGSYIVYIGKQSYKLKF